jgi:hypothetical protein
MIRVSGDALATTTLPERAGRLSDLPLIARVVGVAISHAQLMGEDNKVARLRAGLLWTLLAGL